MDWKDYWAICDPKKVTKKEAFVLWTLDVSEVNPEVFSNTGYKEFSDIVDVMSDMVEDGPFYDFGEVDSLLTTLVERDILEFNIPERIH